jgi:hypothetical protein
LEKGGAEVGGRKETYLITHVTAADSDPRKVAVALEIWQRALADQVIAEGVQEQKPTAHIEVGPRRRKAKKARVSGASRNA